jgi:hypothetical protein
MEESKQMQRSAIESSLITPNKSSENLTDKGSNKDSLLITDQDPFDARPSEKRLNHTLAESQFSGRGSIRVTQTTNSNIEEEKAGSREPLLYQTQQR